VETNGAGSRDANDWDESYDLVIVGSGGASVSAALVAIAAGKRPLVLEKQSLIGGSTALSGGVIWAPNNPLMKRAGVDDSYEKAAEYLDACAGPPSPGSTRERRSAFLREVPVVIEFLQRHGMEWLYARGWSDYHEGHYPGGVADGRSVVAEIFDMRQLGPWRSRMARTPRPPVRRTEVSGLMLYGRTWRSRLAMVRVALRMILNALGRDLVGSGAALQGRLFKLAFDRGVEIRPNSPVTELVWDGERVAGVVVGGDAGSRRIRATDGVIIDAGGFSHNSEMRETYQPTPTSTKWTHANPGDTGEIMLMAMKLGAATASMDLAWWNSISVQPSGAKPGNVIDISHPYCIVVDQNAQRYVNESTSYVAVGIAMYERQKTVPAVPSFAILDGRHRQFYIWGGRKPGSTPPEWFSSGYMVKAQSIEELARRCGLEPAALRVTVERFNGFVKTGRDEDFHRGESAYDNFFGDPKVKPNPNLGSIETPPFYAVRLYPGDVGTAGGLVTDEYARVTREGGEAIAGLYAAGNATAPVVGRSYPGAGASIAAAIVFGFIAAKHALKIQSEI
jgi:3-oxosteroid 1-dehydrogenase